MKYIAAIYRFMSIIGPVKVQNSWEILNGLRGFSSHVSSYS